MRKRKDPKARTKGELQKVGVTLVKDKRSIQLWCNSCGQNWSPNLLSGGRLPKDYWKCPRGCNV